MTLSYDEVAVSPWSDCDSDVDAATLTVTVTGHCCRCEHLTVYTFENVWATGASSSQQPADSIVTVLCDCGAEHPGRGSDDSGCGAYRYHELEQPQ